jgi:hypothetical protein
MVWLLQNAHSVFLVLTFFIPISMTILQTIISRYFIFLKICSSYFCYQPEDLPGSNNEVTGLFA